MKKTTTKKTTSRTTTFKSFDDLPLMLSVPELSAVLGIGLAHAYEIARREDFPTIKLGSRILIPKDRLIQWLNEQADKKSEIF